MKTMNLSINLCTHVYMYIFKCVYDIYMFMSFEKIMPLSLSNFFIIIEYNIDITFCLSKIY